MTRTEAATAGARFYDSKPCKRDGDARRYTASGHCVTCARRLSAERAAKFAALIKAGRR